MPLTSAQLAGTSTPDLLDERAACIYLSGPTAPCSDRVREFHADQADRLSDELDTRQH